MHPKSFDLILALSAAEPKQWVSRHGCANFGVPRALQWRLPEATLRLLRSVTDLKSWIAKGSWSALAAAFTVGASMNVAWAAGSSATDQELPDLGSPATAAVSLEEEYQVGRMWARQMWAQGLVIEDPEVSDYIQEIGHSLSSHAEEGQHQFNYFVVRDPAINAFAMPGGFIAINSGLIVATHNENELAGVMAHETAHVTQRHLVRGMIDQTHAGLVSVAAMLAAILLGATAGRGSPGAMEGAILATEGAAIQHQINYTRSQEFEADRIGIYTMASAGFDPLGMPTFF